MKRPTRLLTLSAALCAAGALSAQNWTLIDDFDDDVNGDNFSQWEFGRGQNVIGPLPEYEEGDEAFLTLMYFNPEDPTDAGLHLETGGYGVANQYGTAWAICPIPLTDLGDGTVSTFYYQYYQDGSSNEFHFGVTTLPKIETPQEDLVFPLRQLLDQPGADWNQYSLLYRVKYTNTIEMHNGSYTFSTNGILQSYTWYEFWFVIRNGEGNTTGDDLWELWVRGGEFTEKTKLIIPPALEFNPITGQPNPPQDFAIWRNASTDPLTYVIFGSQTGDPKNPNNGDPHVIDDLYITEGEYVETPPGVTPKQGLELWNGYGVLSDGSTTWPSSELLKWVETGEGFIGTVVLPDGWPTVDTSWVYSFLLSDWVWANEDILEDEGAGWVYIRSLEALQLDGWPTINASWVYSSTLNGWVWVGDDIIAGASAGWVYIYN